MKMVSPRLYFVIQILVYINWEEMKISTCYLTDNLLPPLHMPRNIVVGKQFIVATTVWNYELLIICPSPNYNYKEPHNNLMILLDVCSNKIYLHHLSQKLQQMYKYQAPVIDVREY